MHMNSSVFHKWATNPHCGFGNSLSYRSNKGNLPVNIITARFLVTNQLGTSSVCVCCLERVCLCDLGVYVYTRYIVFVSSTTECMNL